MARVPSSVALEPGIAHFHIVCLPFFQGVFRIFPFLYLLLNGFSKTRQPRTSLGFCLLTENKPGVADMMIRVEPQMGKKCLVNLWVNL